MSNIVLFKRGENNVELLDKVSKRYQKVNVKKLM